VYVFLILAIIFIIIAKVAFILIGSGLLCLGIKLKNLIFR